jgi:flagellar biogenesis protein FliO
VALRPGLRPTWRAGLIGLACTLALLTASPAALAGGFKDRTPLPAAVSNGTTTTDAGGGSSGSSGAFVRMIVGLGIVLAVIYGVYWLLRAHARAKERPDGDGRMQVLASTTLAPDRAVHLVRVGEELILVGTAPNAVAPLRIYRAEAAKRLAPYLDENAALRPLDPGADSGSALAKLTDELRRRTAR